MTCLPIHVHVSSPHFKMLIRIVAVALLGFSSTNALPTRTPSLVCTDASQYGANSNCHAEVIPLPDNVFSPRDEDSVAEISQLTKRAPTPEPILIPVLLAGFIDAIRQRIEKKKHKDE